MRKSVEECREEARRAGQFTSQDPERYGHSLLTSMEADIEDFLTQIPVDVQEAYETRLVQLYKEWFRAQSRCFSVLVTGAGNFNQRKHQQMNDRERAAYERIQAWKEKTVKRLNRKERMTGMAEAERLRAILEAAEEAHEKMKQVNQICRRKCTDEEQVDAIVAECGLSEETAKELVYPNPDRGTYRKGFASYQLSLNLAKIKDLRAKIARHEAMAEKEDKVLEFEDFDVELDYQEERLRIRHHEKPDAATIQSLKSEGFRWSPNNKAWQRQLTTNAIFAARRVLNLTPEQWKEKLNEYKPEERKEQ